MGKSTINGLTAWVLTMLAHINHYWQYINNHQPVNQRVSYEATSFLSTVAGCFNPLAPLLQEATNVRGGHSLVDGFKVCEVSGCMFLF